jgi:hypothetical protein
MVERHAARKKQMNLLAVAAARHRVLRSAVIWIGGGDASIHPAAPDHTGCYGGVNTLEKRVKDKKARNPIIGGESGILFAVDVRQKPQGAGARVGAPGEENKEGDEGEMLPASVVNILGRQADSGHSRGNGHAAQDVIKYGIMTSSAADQRRKMTNATVSGLMADNKALTLIGLEKRSSAFGGGGAANAGSEETPSQLREGVIGQFAPQSGDHMSSATGSDMLLVLPNPISL